MSTLTHETESVYNVEPYPVLEVGTMITLRMRGHSRTDGKEYFASAIVLQQYERDGEIDAIIFDQTSGVSIVNANPIREVGARPGRAGGPMNEHYVVQSNIGAIIFNPRELSDMARELLTLSIRVRELEMLIADTVPENINALEAPKHEAKKK